MTMKTVIGYLVLILESIIMCSIGYSIFTWQWWTIMMLTILYSFIMSSTNFIPLSLASQYILAFCGIFHFFFLSYVIIFIICIFSIKYFK